MKRLSLLLATLFFLTPSLLHASFGTPTVTAGTCATATTCAITPPATPAGDMLIGYAMTTNTSVTISSVSGRATGSLPSGAWYRYGGGGGVASNICSASTAGGSIDCAVLAVSTGGSGAITFTFSGASGGARVFIIDVPYTAGPVWPGENPQALAQAAGATITGASFHPVGPNDFCVQGIQAAQNISSIGGNYTMTGSTSAAVAYLSNTLVGTAPTWTLASSGLAAVSGICVTEGAGTANPLLHYQWYVANRTQYDLLECAIPSNVTVSNGYLIVNTVAQTQSCSSIDSAYTSRSFTGGQVTTRNFSFLYGTLEFKAKFGINGLNNGAHTNLYMFDASCLSSFPTGTDNNCVTPNEIDVAELLNSNTSINQQIHVPGHNDQCSPALTDPSLNFHVYQLVWSAGSLIWKIDGTTTCTITQAYVPSTAMMLIYNTVLTNGTPSNLPWQTQIDYIKVTNASGAVIFNDDFTNVVAR